MPKNEMTEHDDNDDGPQFFAIAKGRPGECRRCGAPVLWCTTIAGKQMPLEGESRTGLLFSSNLQFEHRVRMARHPGKTRPVTVRSDAHERQCRGEGATITIDTHIVWRIPSSLSHFANCKGQR